MHAHRVPLFSLSAQVDSDLEANEHEPTDCSSRAVAQADFRTEFYASRLPNGRGHMLCSVEELALR
jgi:hypothetical protein